MIWPDDFVGKIICGDCIRVMGGIPNNSIDLIVTSPPYNCGVDYDVHNDSMPWKDYLIWCEGWMSECRRILKPDGRICINVLLEMGIEDNKKRISPFAHFYQLFQKCKINFFGCPVWADSHRVKYTAWGSWMSAKSPYIYCPYEVVIIGYKERWRKDKSGESTISKEQFMEGCSGVWKIKPQTSQFTKANFPLTLPAMCINLLSFEGDIVLDPFVGSGTTAVVAKSLGRNFVGIEISKEYCKIAKDRLKQEVLL